MRALRGALLAFLLLTAARADAAWHSVLQAAIPSGAASPAIDGTAPMAAPSSPFTLTTTHTNDIIVLLCNNIGGNAVTAVSDTAALTWVNRAASAVANASYWYAKSAGVLTGDTITVTYSFGAGAVTCTVFGVSGTVFATPFDTNASLPSYTAAASTTYSTSNAADLAISFYNSSLNAVPSQPTGFTNIVTSAVNNAAGQRTLSTTQSSVTVTMPDNPNFALVDAFQ